MVFRQGLYIKTNKISLYSPGFSQSQFFGSLHNPFNHEALTLPKSVLCRIHFYTLPSLASTRRCSLGPSGSMAYVLNQKKDFFVCIDRFHFISMKPLFVLNCLFFICFIHLILYSQSIFILLLKQIFYFFRFLVKNIT